MGQGLGLGLGQGFWLGLGLGFGLGLGLGFGLGLGLGLGLYLLGLYLAQRGPRPCVAEEVRGGLGVHKGQRDELCDARGRAAAERARLHHLGLGLVRARVRARVGARVGVGVGARVGVRRRSERACTT